jgi:hypothetical protein
MNPEHDRRLGSLLKNWQPQIDLPPRFESEVWHRIALAQEKRFSFWSLDWLFRITCQPRLAFAIVASAVLLGTGLANWEAQRSYQHDMAASKSRYIQSVDPFANTLLTSNP